MIDFYTWTTPNGRKVSILLEELGLEYETHPINIGKDDQFADDFLAISPNNKIPAIKDSDNGLTLMESGAILWYLADKHDQFIGSDAQSRTKVMEWLMWQMGGLGPMAGQTHHFLKFNQGVSEYAENRFSNETRRLYGVMEKELGKKAYIAGDYSIADMACWPWISRFEWQQMDLHEFPSLKRWYIEIAERPAVQKGYHIPSFTTDIPMP